MSRPRSLAALPLVALVALALPACATGFGCDYYANVSVIVNVTDTEGAPVTDVEVTYEAEDGAPPQDCETYEAGVYACGLEVEGEVSITVARADDGLWMGTVLVDSDACHVISQELDVVVPPAA